jgi:RimJ/RimL family protein N-acetyltransferase
MRLERTQDAELIKSVVTHDSIWPHVSEDCVSRETWEPLIHDMVYELAIYDDDGFGGCFILTPESSICWQVHTCILPSHRGKKAIEAAKMCISWMFENTTCESIITKVPTYNAAALRLAINAGMSELCTIGKCWLKDGKAYDMKLLGVLKCQ